MGLKTYKDKEKAKGLLERIGIPETWKFLNKLNESGRGSSPPIIIEEDSETIIKVKDGEYISLL